MTINNKAGPSKGELDSIVSMYRQRRYEDVLQLVSSQLQKFPGSSDLFNLQGMANTALKKDNEAILSFKKVIENDSSHAGAYYNLGIVYKRNGRLEESIESYKRAISIKSDYVQAHNNLGILLKDKGEYEEAINYVNQYQGIAIPDDSNQAYVGDKLKNKIEGHERAGNIVMWSSIVIFFIWLFLYLKSKDSKNYQYIKIILISVLIFFVMRSAISGGELVRDHGLGTPQPTLKEPLNYPSNK